MRRGDTAWITEGKREYAHPPSGAGYRREGGAQGGTGIAGTAPERGEPAVLLIVAIQFCDEDPRGPD